MASKTSKNGKLPIWIPVISSLVLALGGIIGVLLQKNRAENSPNSGAQQSTAYPAGYISPEHAKEFVNESKMVCGIVFSVSERTGNTFLNFGGRFPNHVFCIVI